MKTSVREAARMERQRKLAENLREKVSRACPVRLASLPTTPPPLYLAWPGCGLAIRE
jgi:hypothetical protein